MLLNLKHFTSKFNHLNVIDILYLLYITTVLIYYNIKLIII